MSAVLSALSFLFMLQFASALPCGECAPMNGPPTYGPPTYGPPAIELTIASFRQNDPACPTARSCPGPLGIEQICRNISDAFECSDRWSSGFAGHLTGSGGDAEAMSLAMCEVLCGECAATIEYQSFVDALVVLADA